MANKLSNWCQEPCSTVGTGALNLTGVLSTSQSRFRDGLVSGEVYYAVADGSSREAGIGTFNGTNSITRTTVHATLVSGVYNNTDPVAISLTGEAVVEGTFNNHAYQEIVDTLATNTTAISGNAANIALLQATTPTTAQKAALDVSSNPSGTNAYVTQSVLTTSDGNLSTHINNATGAHAATAISFTDTDLAAVNVDTAIKEVDGRVDTANSNLTTHIDLGTGAHAASAVSFDKTNTTLAATDTQAAIAENNTDIDAHVGDTFDAHDATAVSYDNTTSLLTAVNTQTAIDELNTNIGTGDTALTTHINNSTGAHAASAISYDNTDSTLTETDTKAAIDKLDSNHQTLDSDVGYRETAISALESGGTVTQNGPTIVNIATGQGEIVDSYTDPENQITAEVNWVAQDFDLLLNGGMPVATGLGFTSIGMDTLGSPVAAPNGFSSGQRRNVIKLATIEYQDQVITKVNFAPIVSNQVGNTLMDLIEFIELGNRIKGLVLRPTDLLVPDLSMWRDSGTLFAVGSNYINSKADQNVEVIPADGDPQTPFANFAPFTYNNGTPNILAPIGVVPTDNYEPDSDGNLSAISNGQTVIHYLFESLGGGHYMAYAQKQYATHAEAVTNLFADKASFNFATETDSMILLGQIVVDKNATVWGATAEIYPIDSATSSGSGSGSATSAINISYTDNYSIGANVQSALDSLAKLKLSTNERAAMDTTSDVANPNVPTITNYFVTKNDLTGVNKLPIDADTLDTLDSTSFLRSDEADAKTIGDLTLDTDIGLNLSTTARLFSDDTNTTLTQEVGSMSFTDALDAPILTVEQVNVKVQNELRIITGNIELDGVGATVDGVDVSALDTEVSDHIAGTADKHNATAVVYTPSGDIVATNVSTAITELDTEKAALAGATFTGQAKGITPVSPEDLTRKDWVETNSLSPTELNQAIGNINNPLLDLPLNNSLAPKQGVGQVDFTRASTATYVDRYGVVQTAGIDEPRFEKEGLLIEGASTNYVPNSENLLAEFTVQNGTFVSDPEIGPDGVSASVLLTATAADGVIYDFLSGGTAGDVYTASIWIKRKTGTGGVSITSGQDIKIPVVVTNEWTRVQVTGGAIADGTNRFKVNLDVSGDAVYLAKAQSEKLPFMSSYMPTVDLSFGTRAADLAVTTGAGNLANDIFTVVFDFYYETPFPVLSRTIIRATGTPNDIFSFFRWDGAENSMAIYYNAVLRFTITTLTPLVKNRIAISYDGTSLRTYLDGNILSTNITATAVNIPDSISIEGAIDNISNLRTFDRVLTDNEINLL